MTEEAPIEAPKAEEMREEAVDLDRIHVQNLPKFLGFKQFKKVLEKSLGTIKVKKVRQMQEDAYISFETAEDAQESLKILNGLEIKKNVLVATLAQPEPRKFQPAKNNDENNEEAVITPKTARESVTPYADVAYDEQLRLKDKECLKLLNRLMDQMKRANITIAKGQKLLKTIKPSPKIRHYRNKCEFTVGKSLKDETIVGFVGGRFSKNQHYVIPIDDVDNITNHCKSIVKVFQQFIIDSGLPTFDEYNRTGVWKMLTVREFTGDVMLIVTAAPIAYLEQEKTVKERLVNYFMDESVFEEKKVRITSIYWQTQANSSDPVQYEHVAGVPYIYETVLDCRFRVSPSAFFQTNSQAASVLYTTIGEACGFSEVIVPPPAIPTSAPDDEPETKKIKLEEENKPSEESKPEEEKRAKVLLDICCGTGTIGQCLIKKFNSGNNICCIGVEMIASAIEDAKQNAKDNGIQNIKYIAGKAEDVFRSLKYYLPSGVSLETSEVVGVLDPPRAGMHEKVILGCRDMSKMTKLIFVSCDPSAAMKNIVDLCRPESKKFSGKAFSIETIQPVDMFPQTKHFEWIINPGVSVPSTAYNTPRSGPGSARSKISSHRSRRPISRCEFDPVALREEWLRNAILYDDSRAPTEYSYVIGRPHVEKELRLPKAAISIVFLLRQYSMQHLLKVALLLLALILQLASSFPFPVDMTPQTYKGTIQGSPVIAVIHGSSDIQKDDIREKDSEDDPLSKFGPVIGDHSD